jgi:SLT domain-containing protein
MDKNCLNAVKTNSEDGAQRIVNSLIVRNDLYARKNFGSGRDNATGIVMYITLDE